MPRCKLCNRQFRRRAKSERRYCSPRCRKLALGAARRQAVARAEILALKREKTRLPETPTAYLPGTPGKIEVMAKRRQNKEDLFHPLDAMTYEDTLALTQHFLSLLTRGI